MMALPRRPLAALSSGVDVLYLAWNRLEFTRFTFDNMLRQTDWGLVRRLVVYDDGSTDGTREWLEARVSVANDHLYPGVEVELRCTSFGSPVAVMNDYVFDHDEPPPAPWFVKLDNDIAVPPGWLPDLLAVAEANQHIDLLGFEGGWFGPPGHNGQPSEGPRRAEPCSHIGGVGLMRHRAFRDRPRPVVNGTRFGFTEWQSRYEPNRAWIAPDLLAGCLDRVPVDPWLTLSASYVDAGWQRPWPTYDPQFPYWWDWYPDDLVARTSGSLG